ncbi:MAG TPA: ankyrin repeat domain-containing protein [Burkholderiaceae bacterium]
MSSHEHKHGRAADMEIAHEIEMQCRCSSERLARYLTASAIKCILADSRIDLTRPEAPPPLLVAARNGLAICVRALLADRRVDPNQTFGDGSTALMLAAERGHVDVVAVLLNDARVEPRKARPDGATALNLAVENGYAEVVDALLKYFAISAAQPEGGCATALRFARQ